MQCNRFRVALLASTVLVHVFASALEERPLLLSGGYWGEMFPDLLEVHTDSASPLLGTTETPSASGGGGTIYASARINGVGALEARGVLANGNG